MRKPLILLLTFAALLAYGTPEWATAGQNGAENRPHPLLTPGEVGSTDKAAICQKGYSKTIRKTTAAMKRQAYLSYGVLDHHGYKIDHLVPLCLGGADTQKNIWPSNFKAGHYNASAKDRLELKMHYLVCYQDYDLQEAQKMFMTDWQKGYDRFCPTQASCPTYGELHPELKKRPSRGHPK